MSRLFRYIGASDDQVNYRGNDDPRGVLSEGHIYVASIVDEGDWHTDIYLEGNWNKRFNSVCFEEQASGVPFFFKQLGKYVPCERWAPGSINTGDASMIRVGKKAAGCLLDGREWKEFPTGRRK